VSRDGISFATQEDEVTDALVRASCNWTNRKSYLLKLRKAYEQAFILLLFILVSELCQEVFAKMAPARLGPIKICKIQDDEIDCSEMEGQLPSLG